MRNLLIVGSGGFGRETAAAVHAVNSVAPTWNLLGFVDDDVERHGATIHGVPVLGPLDIAAERKDVAAVVTTGSPGNYFSRRMIVERLGLPIDRFVTILHPAAVVGSGADIGLGSVLLAGSVITTDATIGQHVTVMPHVTITHDNWVGDYCSLAAGAGIAGFARVEAGAYIGAGANINSGLTVGAWSLVGMGSTVLSDVPPGEVWVGTPARRLRSVQLPSDWDGDA